MRWTFFRPRTRLTYAPEVCARIKTLCSVCVLPREKEVCTQVCAEPKAPMDCLGQSSFETGYALGMRQPHSSSMWAQSGYGQTLIIVSYLCAEGMRPIYIYIYIRRVN